MMNEEPVFKPYGFQKVKLLSLMKQQNLKGILLSSAENVYYTTCFTALPSSGNPILHSLKNIFPFFVYISDEGEVTLICWGYSTFGVQFGADKIKGFGNYEEAIKTLENHLKSMLGESDVLGIESTCPYYAINLIQQKVKPKALMVIDHTIESLRLIKSAKELELLRKSTEIIETTLTELYADVRIGMSRLELMQKAKAKLFKNGATGISHLTFSFGKANPEVAIGEKLDANKLVTLDLGGIYKGYCSDNRRYMYSGEIPQALIEHYNKMVDIVDGVGAALIPGAKYSDVVQTAINLFAKHDIQIGREINHVGHNIGLQTEEQWITNTSEYQVKAGMAINIELYSPSPTGDYIGDEETYLIESSGPRRISVLPREIKQVV
jgi:Xaa-Pro aminopeptidase